MRISVARVKIFKIYKHYFRSFSDTTSAAKSIRCYRLVAWKIKIDVFCRFLSKNTELGLALGLDKEVILIASKRTKLPSGLVRQEVIFYSKDLERLKMDLNSCFKIFK